MADGALIQRYIEGAARDEGIDQKVQFGHKVTATEWRSDEQRWTVRVKAGGVRKQYQAHWVISCAGYYNYHKPLAAEIPGIERFQGVVAHPQFWPSDLDWSGKRVVIIGSGATAITLLPHIAKTAAHATMLQRSPSYVFSVPAVEPESVWLKKYLPARLAYPINWWRCFLTETLFIWFLVVFPNLGRKLLMSLMRQQLPKDIPVDIHFNPRYPPTEQRLCMCPDGDFFKALHQANCDIVTSPIRTVEANGILTETGEKLDADIIITATGLHVQILGGITPIVDGNPVDIGTSMAWRGVMLSGVPNAGTIMGYTVNTWTPGADAAVKMLIRVYKHMRDSGAASAVPVYDGGDLKQSRPVVGHSSTYFVKAQKRLPRITGKSPWYGRVNAVYDYFMLWFGSVTSGMTYVMPRKKDQ